MHDVYAREIIALQFFLRFDPRFGHSIRHSTYPRPIILPRLEQKPPLSDGVQEIRICPVPAMRRTVEIQYYFRNENWFPLP